MNYLQIDYEDVCNGEGIRVTLWLSGCSHRCKGCHNSQTWNPIGGSVFDAKAKQRLFEELTKSYVLGIMGIAALYSLTVFPKDFPVTVKSRQVISSPEL